MPLNTIKLLICAILLGIASGLPWAQPMPRILQDPLLGLRYEPATIHFAPLPTKMLNDCPLLTDGGHSKRAFFIFASAADASGRIFYLLNGYETLRRNGDGRSPQYVVDEYGPIIMIHDHACVIIDHEGGDRFQERIFTEEYSQDIQQRLLIDYANRLATAYGGKERLRMELLNQLVDVDTLPEELRRAFRDLRLTK